MARCVVLTDQVVHDDLASTLKDFSTGDGREYQPDASVVTRPSGIKSLFRPFSSPTGVGVKINVDPTTAPSYWSTGARQALHGVVVICDEPGLPRGFLNGDELTGCRTPLNVMVSYSWQQETAKIAIFGAGKQALWHMCLALALRGSDITNITVVSRSREGLSDIISRLKTENDNIWRSGVHFDTINLEQAGSESNLERAVSGADVIFCTTPAKKPLFPACWLIPRLAEGRGIYLSAIGSWQPDMVEIDPEPLNKVAGSASGYNPHGKIGGVILVDDREVAQQSTGEFAKSKVSTEHIVEVGEVLHWKSRLSIEPQKDLTHWLEEGFMVYKSIGVGLTDLSAANSVLNLAEKHNKGVFVGNLSSKR